MMEGMRMGFGTSEIVVVVLFLLTMVIPIWPVFRILRRVGFSPAWGLTAVVPLVNVAMLWVFAFVDWPIEKRG
jgi:hypothetical protein